MKNFVGSKILLGEKNLLGNKNLGPKNILCPRIFFGQKQLWVKINFLVKKRFSGQQAKLCFSEKLNF